MLNQNQRYWLLSDALIVAISFVFKFCLDRVAFNFNENENFDIKLHVFQ